MKQLILNIILSLLIVNCKGQETKKDTIIIKQDAMEYFNQNKYTDWELQKNSSNTNKYYKEGNTLVRVIFYNGEHTEEIEEINSPYKIYKYYYKNTLLKNSIQTFYGFPIDVAKEYDENGKLIKETDNDKDYPFKVEDLCRLIKEEYGVDLMVKPDQNKEKLQYRVSRSYDSSIDKHLYLVSFTYGNPDIEPGDKIFPPIKVVYIDGNNGKVLYEESHSLNLHNGDKIPNSKSKFPQKGEKEKKTSAVYKTHNGKSYTQAEWEAFEEKEYEAYCERTGRPYIPKNLRTPGFKSPFIAQKGEKGDDNPPKKKGFWDNLFG